MHAFQCQTIDSTLCTLYCAILVHMQINTWVICGQSWHNVLAESRREQKPIILPGIFYISINIPLYLNNSFPNFCFDWHYSKCFNKIRVHSNINRTIIPIQACLIIVLWIITWFYIQHFNCKCRTCFIPQRYHISFLNWQAMKSLLTAFWRNQQYHNKNVLYCI